MLACQNILAHPHIWPCLSMAPPTLFAFFKFAWGRGYVLTAGASYSLITLLYGVLSSVCIIIRLLPVKI